MTPANPEGEDYLASGFRNVDAAAVDKMARCLTYLDGLPGFQQYKSAILDLMRLQRGSIAADLGCGLGFDVRRLAALVGPEGRAIGVDASLALIASARAASEGLPAVEFIHADIQNLPFGNGYLNSCKVDRTLQHVEHPAAVVKEMFRIVSPGGAVVCAEPDWATFAIEDVNQPMVQQISTIWSGSFRNPRIGSQLRNYLHQAGFVDIENQDALLMAPSFESSEIVFDITQSASRLAAAAGSGEPLEWLAQLKQRDPVIPVRCSVTLIISSARRP
jgi:ubiquinone/menaquinone biosynthesis C-methylase UbiE